MPRITTTPTRRQQAGALPIGQKPGYGLTIPRNQLLGSPGINARDVDTRDLDRTECSWIGDDHRGDSRFVEDRPCFVRGRWVRELRNWNQASISALHPAAPPVKFQPASRILGA